MNTDSTTYSRSFLKKASTQLNRLKKVTLKKLDQFRQTGQWITVTSSALGEGEFVSLVEDIYESGAEAIVVLKWFDHNNFSFLTHVFLEEIFSVKAVEKRIQTI